ncbi:energy transducer TonB [Pseudomonas sp. ANT_H12B]|uniref:energy transducer TonB n=1 Tax=Pseudomonas sp. ANT_H12B TaxID=2597348 RepID=UPI0011F03918|nr:energy transducer TonB [Pseudomonas sp. ANT_H12B]KAA0978165.1 energy transducer TonB [Pseudomonas sp. ANT_H12B]
MRWFAFVLLWIVAIGVRAGEVFLIPENNPKPIYPRELFRAGITGEVRVRFTVNADGSVDKLSILQSDHPDLAEAARKAIAQWRFKPWVIEGDKPAELVVTAPMVFRLDLDTPIHTNQWLKQLRCRDINEALVDFPEYAWVDSKVFDYTRAYLSNVIYTTQLQNEQRLALIARLNKRVPRIVRECRASPVRKYMSLLPKEISELL